MRFATALHFTDQSACLCAVMHRLSIVMRNVFRQRVEPSIMHSYALHLGTPFLTMNAIMHTALLLYHCIYSYKLIFKLKDPIKTPMAQQVCSRMFL